MAHTDAVKKALGIIAILPLLAACGGTSSDPGASTQGAAPVPITIMLHDAGSADALFNLGGGVCETSNVGEAMQVTGANPGATLKELRALLPKTQITVKDDAGKVVAVKTLPRVGGAFSKAGCTWPLTFKVAPSGFYDITVSHGDFSMAQESKLNGHVISFSF